jgi:hypothetical protein
MRYQTAMSESPTGGGTAGGMVGSRRKPKVSRMSIETTENGGYVVEHHYDNSGSGESYMPSKKHAFGNHSAMMGHVDRTLGGISNAVGKPVPRHEPFSGQKMMKGWGGQKPVATAAMGRAASRKHGRGVD